MTDQFGFFPKIKPENVAMIGLRSVDPGERELIKKLNLKVYTMTDIDRKRIGFLHDKILMDFKTYVQHVYVSFDVDSIDPITAPGVGTPISGGLSYREAHLLLESIAEC